MLLFKKKQPSFVILKAIEKVIVFAQATSIFLPNSVFFINETNFCMIKGKMHGFFISIFRSPQKETILAHTYRTDHSEKKKSSFEEWSSSIPIIDKRPRNKAIAMFFLCLVLAHRRYASVTLNTLYSTVYWLYLF